MWAFKLKEKKSPTDLCHHHRIHRDQKRTEPVNKRQHATFLQMLVYKVAGMKKMIIMKKHCNRYVVCDIWPHRMRCIAATRILPLLRLFQRFSHILIKKKPHTQKHSIHFQSFNKSLNIRHYFYRDYSIFLMGTPFSDPVAVRLNKAC